MLGGCNGFGLMVVSRLYDGWNVAGYWMQGSARNSARKSHCGIHEKLGPCGLTHNYAKFFRKLAPFCIAFLF